MKNLKFLPVIITLSLLILFFVNVAWVAFIIVLDLASGVMPQTSVPVFTVIFITGTLMSLVLIGRRAGTAASSAPEAITQTVRPNANRHQTSGRVRRTVLRSALIIARKPARSASETKGRTL